jgi:hypothetical protein
MYNLSGEGLHMNEASAAAVVLIVTVAILNSAAAFAAKGVKAKIWKIK